MLDERSKEKRRKRGQEKETILPRTKMQEKNLWPKSTKSIFWNFKLREPGGNPIAKLLKGVLEQEEVLKLWEETEKLHQKQLPVGSRRGSSTTYHFGCWRRYLQRPTLTKDTKGEAAQKWIESNRPLFAKLSSLFEKEAPGIAREHQKRGHPKIRRSRLPIDPSSR